MKRLLLSMAVLFAFTMTSQAQYDDGLGGGGDPVQPDLTILTVSGPTNFYPEFGTTFYVTVRNRHNMAAAGSSTIRITYSFQMTYPNGLPYTNFGYFYMPVSAFALLEIDKVITVTWSPTPQAFLGLYGGPGNLITIESIEADGLHVITEADETNNLYTL